MDYPPDADPDEPFRFASAIITEGQMPILRVASLAELATNTLLEIFDQHDGQLWGYVILPDSVHLVLEVAEERLYHVFVDAFKDQSEKRLVDAILKYHPALLDRVTRFNPAWGGAIYRIWQEGYHTQPLHSIYAVSNRVAELFNKPVELGLVTDIKDYPYCSYQPE
jgi:REP element-mobilizing transposase RayT